MNRRRFLSLVGWTLALAPIAPLARFAARVLPETVGQIFTIEYYDLEVLKDEYFVSTPFIAYLRSNKPATFDGARDISAPYAFHPLEEEID